jgi:hypothetical protein
MRVRFALLGLLVAACAAPTTPAATGGPHAAISDGASGGNSHFFFLPPLVPNPATAGTADPTLSPEVVICAWDGAACAATLAVFTTDRTTSHSTQPGHSETIRASQHHYLVDWHTRAFGLDPAVTYRICVKVGDVELGFADVDVVASGGERQPETAGFITVLEGRTLPIKFRIEAGALDEGGAGACGGTGPE